MESEGACGAEEDSEEDSAEEDGSRTSRSPAGPRLVEDPRVFGTIVGYCSD